MLRRFRTALAIGLFSTLWCGTALGQVTLQHKIQDDTSYTADSTQKLKQTLTIAGTAIATSSETTSSAKSSVGKRDADGKIRAEQKIESLRISVEVMGMTYSFDSANPDEKGGSPLEILRDVHKALASRTTTVVYDKDNRVIAVEAEDITGSLPANVRDLAKGQLEPDNLKESANADLDQVKREPIKPGDTWQRLRTSNFGAGQMMDFTTEYKYEGTIEKDGRTLDKITSKVVNVTFALANSPLPFTLKSSDLKADESDGELLFDRELGLIVGSTSKVHITGKMTFTINNMDLPAELDLSLETDTVVKS